jgi:hypothetical protein
MRIRQGYIDMLFLRLQGASGSWTIGPAEYIEMRGAEMLFPSRAEPVVQYRGAWVVDGKRCTFVECRAMLSIQFEDHTGRIGPIIGLRTAFGLRGPYAFAGRERIAKLDPLAGRWYRTDTQEHWPCLRIMPAPIDRH